jgi:hypothetical protein
LRACLAALAIALCASLSAATHAVSAPTISLLNTGHVSTDLPNAQFVETTLAAHPRDPDNLIASTMALDGGSTTVAVYATHDGGRSWLPGRPSPNDTSRKDALDPWVIFTSDGTALFTYLRRRELLR